MQPDASPRFSDFVIKVLDALNAAEIPYLIGGAVATWAWGEPRTTQDIDLVIELPFEAMAAFSSELKQRGMLVPVENMVDLMIERRADLPLNAIDTLSGFKAEFFLLKPGDDFRASSLARRQLADLGPPLGEVYVHAPEDLILNKLTYYQISRQTKHVRDIAGILSNLRDKIDRHYIGSWAERLELNETWQEILSSIADSDG